MKFFKNKDGQGKRLKFSLRPVLEVLTEVLYLALAFFIPLFFFPDIWKTYNVFELPKTSLFLILSSLIVLSVVFKALFYPAVRPAWNRKKYWLFLPLAAVALIGVSQIFSIDRTQSFFGSYNWQSGYLVLLAGLALFFSLAWEFSRLPADILKKRLHRFLAAVSISGVLVSLYALAQLAGFDFASWPENPLLTKRAFSSLGQPNFLASWVLLVLPIAAAEAYIHRRRLSGFFWLLAFLLETAAILSSSSRGALASLAAMGLVLSALAVTRGKFSRRRKASIVLAVIVFLAGSAAVLEIMLPGRIQSLADFGSGSLGARMDFYQAAYDAFLQKPVFGSGLGNSGLVLFPYYSADWSVFGNVASLTDKAHNLILDTLLCSGLVGLAAYLLLGAYSVFAVREARRRRIFFPWASVLAVGLGLYFLSLLFNFACIAGSAYSWMFLAFLTGFAFCPEKAPAPAAIPSRRRPLRVSVSILAAAAVSILAAWTIIYSFRIFLADYYYYQLYNYLNQGDIFTVMALEDQVTGAGGSPVNQEYYRRLLAQNLISLYGQIDDRLLKFAITRQEAAIRGRLDTSFWDGILTAGEVDSFLGNYRQARVELSSVLAISPYWPNTYQELATLSVREGRGDQALAEYALLKSVLPLSSDPRLNAEHREVLDDYRQNIFRSEGDIYMSEKDYPAAAASYQNAYKADPKDYSLLKKIADSYYARGDLKTALDYTLRGLSRNPDDPSWNQAASLLYKELGDNRRAADYAAKAGN